MLKKKLLNKISLSTPHMSGMEMKYIEEAFETNWIAPLGLNVDEFEKEFAHYVGMKGAVAVSSGTAAIHLALSILDVGKDDIVFCSSLTFIASANPILYQGAHPVFIDSEPESWNMSPNALEEAFKDAVHTGVLPKAVIIVNLYGQSAKMDELVSICQKYNVPIIEDAAESLGAMYQGKASGTFGDIGIYSFNGNKIITTSGGGMLVSHKPEILEKARFLATQAKDPAPHYQHSEIGYNYRMSNILAGVGRGQLEVLNHRISARRVIFQIYKQELADFEGIEFMPELVESLSTRWLTAITVNEKEANVTSRELLQALAENNIEARPVWKPLHMQPLFKQSKYYSNCKEGSVCERLFSTGICLPSSSNLTLKDQVRVIQCLKDRLK
ncbi:DegT/DnrJ/EryC1/StrS family aminotransferase [Bacillus massiliigorillae]|uniref:DegT/DnrJ/EryC1/StrS family aminotransferase n=1 Tax=Bacillus massiliigorillae TaxID=1243664 RepID=UPI0003A60DCA|nr:aminotransferase class I/II-fold pyridoxal phosphate-dependent enzyme [Bacillus massiliigorillae]